MLRNKGRVLRIGIGIAVLTLILLIGSAGAEINGNRIYGFPIENPFQFSKKIVSRSYLEIEALSSLENDTDFQENLAYARTLGYYN